MHLDEVIWPTKYILIMCGVWPMHPNASLARRCFANFQLIVIIVITLGVIIPEVATVTVEWGDIDILGDFGSMTIVHCLGTLKLVYCKCRQQSFRCVYQHIKDFWNISDDPQERLHYERPAQAMKVLCIVFFFASIINLPVFGAVALIGDMRNQREIDESLRYRPLPLEILYGWDIHRTPMYELVFTSQIVGTFCIVSEIVGCDFTMVVFMVHTSTQFKLIAARFCAIGRKIDEQAITMEDDRKLRAEIGKLIAQHQHTIEVTKKLSALLSPVCFAQIVTSGLVICLGGYAILKGNGSTAYIIKYIVFFTALLMQLVAWCASSEFLINESISIAEVIYCEVPWFKLKPSLRRDLNLVLLRAQKACYVSALYQVMSLSRITEVFNAAGSYMAMLNSMKK